MSQYAAELVAARVDVIATGGDEAVRAVQQATKTIPIVALVDDLLGSGFINSLARPDGNTTGVNVLAGDLDGKRQDILIEAVPGLRRMAALAADVNNTAVKLDALREAARAHNIELSIYRITRGEEMPFILGLKDTGFIEGKDLRIEWRRGTFSNDDSHAAADQFSRQRGQTVVLTLCPTSTWRVLECSVE
jgi:hypothetical protein